MKKKKSPPPIISQRNLNRLLFVLLITLAIAAGFFKSAYDTEVRKYNKLEDQFVRLKMMIGEEETTNLIEASYQKIDDQGQILK